MHVGEFGQGKGGLNTDLWLVCLLLSTGEDCSWRDVTETCILSYKKEREKEKIQYLVVVVMMMMMMMMMMIMMMKYFSGRY